MPSASTYRNIPNQDTRCASFLSFSFLDLLVSLCPNLFSPRCLLQYSIRRSVRRYISLKRPLCKNMRLYLSDARFTHTKKKNTNQGYTNPWRQVAPRVPVTKFCPVVPDICVSLLWNLLPFNVAVLKYLSWLTDFWKMCAPLIQVLIIIIAA